MVPLRPVTWGGDIRKWGGERDACRCRRTTPLPPTFPSAPCAPGPHSLIGHRDTFDGSLVVDAYITEPGASVLLGVHMQGTDNSQGILVLFKSDSTWELYNQISSVNSSKPLASGPTPVPVAAGAWHTYRIDINATMLNVWVDGQVGAANANVSGMTTSGHFLIGTGSYGQYTQYDNVQIYSRFKDCATATPAVGSPVVMSNCIAEVGAVPHTLWNFNAPANNGNATWGGLMSVRGHC